MMTNKYNFWLFVLLTFGFLLRLGAAFSTDATLEAMQAGDSVWYLAHGAVLASGETGDTVFGIRVLISGLQSAPLYLLFVGVWVTAFPLSTAIIIVRILQSALNIAICYFAASMGRQITRDDRVGLLTAAALSLSLPMITESVNIMTETLYMFFVVLGLFLYVRQVASTETASPRSAAMVGMAFGLATLTRAVSLLFPVGILFLIILGAGKRYWRKGFLLALSLFIGYSLIVLSWTAYNLVRYDRFVLGSNQFAGAIWRGAVENDGNPFENDELLGEQTPEEQASEIIRADFGGFLQLRAAELSQTLLQPHGTVLYGGESLKALGADWVQSGFQVDALQQLIQSEAFLPKFIIYLWYYPALLLAPLGMLFSSRKQWRMTFVLMGFMAYTLLVHFVGLALPRYLFPMYPLLWMFASIAVFRLWKPRSNTEPKTTGT